MLAAAALRLLAARGDLWLDEIWSVRLAGDAGSILGVFTRLHHDNNHHLNTLWMMLLGPGAPPLAYRLLAVASSSAAVALAAAGALRRGRVAAISTAVLMGASYLLVQYGSEARGYAPAVLCAVAAYLAMERYLETRRTRWSAAFALLSVLGLLSHLTFLFVLAGAWAWAALELARHRRDRPPSWSALALLAAPLGALALLWAIDLRELIVGGGNPWDLADVLRELARTAFGLPRGPLELLAVPLLAVAILEVVLLHRARDGRWLFFVVTVLVAPVAILAARPPEFLASRYFVLVVPFVLMLLGQAAARLAQRGGRGTAAVAALLALFVAGNLVPAARLLEHGRGRYGEAVAMIAARSTAPVITLGSDHDWRNGVVLQDQAARQRVLGRIAYLEQRRWTRDQPEWLILHDFSEQPAAEPLLGTAAGGLYRLEGVFPYAGLSGWSWLVYRRTGAAVR